jgi:hypothetical protein
MMRSERFGLDEFDIKARGVGVNAKALVETAGKLCVR